MDKTNRRELEKAIGQIEDVKTTLEEQSEARDDAALREAANVLDRVSDRLEDIDDKD